MDEFFASGWLYALACVLVPALWGVLMSYVFRLVDRRRRRFNKDDMPPVDYSI